MVDAFTGVRRKRGSQLPNLQDSRLPPQIRTDLDPIGMDFLFIGDRQLSDYESIYWWVSWGSGIYETPLHRQWPLLKGLWWFSHAGTEDHTLSAERNTVSQTLGEILKRPSEISEWEKCEHEWVQTHRILRRVKHLWGTYNNNWYWKLTSCWKNWRKQLRFVPFHGVNLWLMILLNQVSSQTLRRT